jgi:hypothetical protein
MAVFDAGSARLSAQQKDWPNYYTVTPDDTITPAAYPVVDPIRPPCGGHRFPCAADVSARGPGP